MAELVPVAPGEGAEVLGPFLPLTLGYRNRRPINALRHFRRSSSTGSGCWDPQSCCQDHRTEKRSWAANLRNPAPPNWHSETAPNNRCKPGPQIGRTKRSTFSPSQRHSESPGRRSRLPNPVPDPRTPASTSYPKREPAVQPGFPRVDHNYVSWCRQCTNLRRKSEYGGLLYWARKVYQQSPATLHRCCSPANSRSEQPWAP